MRASRFCLPPFRGRLLSPLLGMIAMVPLGSRAETLPVGARIRPVYVGAAFHMTELGQANAAGWRQVRDAGAKLQVHPAGWRGQWEKLGAVVAPNFQAREFLYEYDIVDPRNGVDNLGEIAKVEAFNLKCEAAFCNVDAREMLNNRAQLVDDYTRLVTQPLKKKGVFLYFTFSPVATQEVVDRMPELLQDQEWIAIARQCGANGIGLDFPCSYWKEPSYRTGLIQFIRDARENHFPVLLIDSIISQQDIDDLAQMYDGLEAADALPDAWNMGQFHGPDHPITPEANSDDTPAGTLTGAALWLYRRGFGAKSAP